MRIIAGKHRGRRLFTPKTGAIRPTTDRVRESLFSILGDLTDAIVVDGYAGTGALGCESLSRGARTVYFFDKAREAIDLITRNVELIGEAEHAVIVGRSFLTAMAGVHEPVDLVFLDPPYGSTEPAEALDLLADHPHITAGCLIVLEQDVRDSVPEVDRFTLDDQRTYGDTRLSFFTAI